MKHIKHIILLTTCVLSLPLNAQTLKTYFGAYPQGGSLIGQAKYSYTETEDGERIKQGAFSFATEPGTTQVVSVQGTYKDGGKEGKWTTKIVLQKPRIGARSASNNLEALTSDGVSIMSGNFAGNKRVGQWNYVGGRSADNISRTSTKSTANFVDGLLDGVFSYVYEDPEYKYFLGAFSVSGLLDKGLIDGKWTIKYTDYSKIERIQTMEFDKGKLLSCKVVNTATGDATSPISYEYEGLVFGQDTEQGLKVALYNYFRMLHPDLARVFQMWMGDPSLERYDTFVSANKENFSGFAFLPKQN